MNQFRRGSSTLAGDLTERCGSVFTEKPRISTNSTPRRRRRCLRCSRRGSSGPKASPSASLKTSASVRLLPESCRWLLAVAPEVGVHALANFIATPRQKMAVDVKGRLDFRVPHELLNRLRVRPRVDHQRSEGMTAEVQADRHQPALVLVRCRPSALCPTIDGRSVERLLRRAAENEVVAAAAHPAHMCIQVIPQDREQRDAAPPGEQCRCFHWRSNPLRSLGATAGKVDPLGRVVDQLVTVDSAAVERLNRVKDIADGPCREPGAEQQPLPSMRCTERYDPSSIHLPRTDARNPLAMPR